MRSTCEVRCDVIDVDMPVYILRPFQCLLNSDRYLIITIIYHLLLNMISIYKLFLEYFHK